MRNNRVLAITMATALGGVLGSVNTFAGIQGICYPDTGPAGPAGTATGLCADGGDEGLGEAIPGWTNAAGGDDEQLSLMYVATEAIGKGEPLPNGGDNCEGNGGESVMVSYVTESDWTQNTVVSLSLTDSTGKAIFGFNGLSNTSADGVVANTILTIQDKDDGAGAPIASDANLVLSSGGLGESSMDFTVQLPADTSGLLNKGSTLDFFFCVDKSDVLKTAGESLSVSVGFGNNASSITDAGGSITLLASKSGASGQVNAGADKDLVKVDIGGEAGAKKFTGSSLGDDTVILGEVCLEAAAGSIYGNDLANLWDLFGGGKVDDITFTITKAPFSASIGHEEPEDDDSDDLFSAEQIAKVMVFLDLDRDGLFSENVNIGVGPGDIAATSVSADGAIFEINDDTVENLAALMGTVGHGFQHADAVADDGCIDVIFKASGDAVIETFEEAPTGTMVVNFAGGATGTYIGKLNHIKKSGTFCTLYNVPGALAIENANIRVTNKSAVPEGTLFGTLRLPDGSKPFESVSLGVIGANQTLYIDTATLDAKAKAAGWDAGWQRATLDLESNLNEVEMMGLVRDNDVVGAPLMNMSVGATGNGCGR